MPLWLNHQGVSDSGIGFWMAVMVSAGILGQWPVGAWQTATVACWCCGYRSLWSFWDVWRCLVRRQWLRRCLCLGHLVSRCIRWRWPGPVKVEHHQLVAMNQALLMSYTIGSLLGPTLTAMLMQNFSDNLLFIMIASVSFIYLLTLLRKAGHHPTPVAHA